jgi:hypothetical protein
MNSIKVRIVNIRVVIKHSNNVQFKVDQMQMPNITKKKSFKNYDLTF